VVIELSSVDNGGAPLTELRLQWKAVSEEMWSTLPVDNGLSVLLSGLQPNTEYQIRAQAANRIGVWSKTSYLSNILHSVLYLTGFGPYTSAVEFTTSPPGRPGTPSQPSTSQPESDSLYLCWNASKVGLPFIEYSIFGFVSDVQVGLWTVSVDDLSNGVNCYTVSV